ncbi:MAG: hypothetical protein SNH27_16630 [Rikenellaceae bacterium]
MENIELTEKETAFCELFVFGDKEFAGQAEACYREVYGEGAKNIAITARRLLAREEIAALIVELVEIKESQTETMAVKLQVAETLRAVMKETSKESFTDKFGVDLSPAPLRAVSVNAAKALMEIYPIKHSQGEGSSQANNGGNIVFNVVVPQAIAVDGEPKTE